MKLILVLVTLTLAYSTTTITVASAYQCSCGNAQTQTDCPTEYCTWNSNSTCSNKACSTFIVKGTCQGLPDPFNCVWSDVTNTCQTFTKCSDYSFNISDSSKCYDLVKCQVDVNNYNATTGVIKCMDRSIDSALSISDCTKVYYDDCFWLVQTDGKQCLQNTTTKTCAAQTINSCADYSAAQCNILACYNNNGVCTPLTCSILPEASCKYFFDYNAKSLIFCSWTNGACVDLNVGSLTQSTCMTEATLYSYMWNPTTSKCTLCTPLTSSWAGLLNVFLMVLAVLMN